MDEIDLEVEAGIREVVEAVCEIAERRFPKQRAAQLSFSIAAADWLYAFSTVRYEEDVPFERRSEMRDMFDRRRRGLIEDTRKAIEAGNL